MHEILVLGSSYERQVVTINFYNKILNMTRNNLEKPVNVAD